MYPEEITDISSYLSIDEDSFIIQFTKPCKNPDEKVTRSLQTPCAFLTDGKCMIYPHRPFVCRAYPLVINRDKKEAILSGIYFCPQATQFYEGLINFCRSRNPKHYQNLITNEKKCNISPTGLLLYDSSLIISSYVDWLHSTENNDE
jgi:Fe-S-cluster containining protein